jgi:hypothetical protein
MQWMMQMHRGQQMGVKREELKRNIYRLWWISACRSVDVVCLIRRLLNDVVSASEGIQIWCCINSWLKDYITLISRKRAPDRWSLRNFLPRSSLFMLRKAQKSHGERSGLYDGCSNGITPIHFFPTEHRIEFRSRPHAISGLFEPWKGNSVPNFPPEF